MMRKSIIAISAVGVLAMVSFSALHYYDLANAQKEKTESTNLQNAKYEAETEQLRRQLAQTRSRITGLKNQLSESARNKATTPNTEMNPVPEHWLDQNKPPIDPEEWLRHQSLEPQYAEIQNVYKAESALTEFETNFWLEPQDFQWTDDATTRLQELLEKRNILDTELGHVECHINICWAEFVHTDNHGHDVLLQQFGSMALLSGGYLVKTDEYSSEPRTLIFFPREGEALPLPMELLSNGETL